MADVVLTERQLEVLRAVGGSRRRVVGATIAEGAGIGLDEALFYLSTLGSSGLVAFTLKRGWRPTPEGREALARFGGVR